MRVAQTETVRIKRALDGRLAEAVGVVFFALDGVGARLVGEIKRQLPNRARERDWKFTAGIVVAENHVGDRGAARFTREPRGENRGHMALDIINRGRTAREQHGDHGATGGDQRADEFVLVAGEIEARAAFRFADSGVVVAEKNDDGVGGLGFGDGIGDERGFVGVGWFGEKFRFGPSGVGDFATFGEEHLAARRREARADTVEGRDDFAAIGAVTVERGFGHFRGWAADEQTFELRRKRERRFFVFEENDGFAGGLKRERLARGCANQSCGFFGRGDIRVIENTGGEFHAEDIAHAGIDDFQREAASGDFRAQTFDEDIGLGEMRADIAALADEHRGGFGIRRDEVVFGLQEFNRLAVGDDVALETPLGAETVDEELATTGDRDAVVVVVGTHEAADADFFDDAFPRAEMEQLHLARGDVRIGARSAVAAAFGLGINGEVFGRGRHASVLQCACHTDAEFGDVIRIFTVGLDDATPARITGEVEERRVNAGVADRAGFAGDHGADARE